MRKRHQFRPSVWDRLEIRITPSASGFAHSAGIVQIDARVEHAKGLTHESVRHTHHHAIPPGVGTLASGYKSNISTTLMAFTGGTGESATGTGGASFGGFHPRFGGGGLGAGGLGGGGGSGGGGGGGSTGGGGGGGGSPGY